MSGTEVKQAYSARLLGSCDVEGVTNMGSSTGAPGFGAPQVFDRRSMMQPDGSPLPFARENTQAQPQAFESPPPPVIGSSPAVGDKSTKAAEKAKKASKNLLSI